MSEDTKADKKRKEPLSRADYHNVIVAYVAIVLSVISLFVDVIQAFPRESIQILWAEDDGYYHFDGEKLFKNFQVTVANNSAIPVSVVEITIERDGEARTFKISDLSDILPLNMEANHTDMIIIPWSINLLAEDMQTLREHMGEIKSDFLIPIKPPQQWAVPIKDLIDTGPVEIWDIFQQSSLSINLRTAKNNQYILTATDWQLVWRGSEGKGVSLFGIGNEGFAPRP